MIAEPSSTPAREQRICILFAESDGFAAFCDGRPPWEVHAHLEALYRPMVAAIAGAGGVVDKFLGDGLMALFGVEAAPDADSVAAALAAARGLLAGVDAAIAGGTLRPTTVRASVHLGDAMVGRIGAPPRYELTAVGHTVNVAARLQGAASREGTRLLVSDDAIAALPAPPSDLVPIGPLALKGFRQPVGAWKLP